MNSLAHPIYTRVAPVSDDGDAIDCCTGHLDKAIDGLNVQAKGCGFSARQAIESAAQEIEAIKDKLTIAMRKERTAEIGGRF